MTATARAISQTAIPTPALEAMPLIISVDDHILEPRDLCCLTGRIRRRKIMFGFQAADGLGLAAADVVGALLAELPEDAPESLIDELGTLASEGAAP